LIYPLSRLRERARVRVHKFKTLSLALPQKLGEGT